MPGSEDLVIGPTAVLAQQAREGLVVDEDGQKVAPALLVREFGITETIAGGLPVRGREEFTTEFPEVARDEQDSVT